MEYNILKIILNYNSADGSPDGSIKEVVQDFRIYQNSYNNIKVQIYVPETYYWVFEQNLGVKTGGILTKPNGLTKTTKFYLTELLDQVETINNRRYRVFEQYLSAEFTQYAGTQDFIVNIIELNGQTIQRIITSDICKLEVYESAYLFEQEPVLPSQIDFLNAQLNNKQDKIDSRINIVNIDSETPLITTHGVVQSINELSSQVAENTRDIATDETNINDNTNNISSLESRVETLEQTVGTSETYIGTITGITPTLSNEILNAKVYEVAGRPPRNLDVIIYIQEITGQTDRNYKYIYSSVNDSWSYYEIPSMESASNTDKGIIKGTLIEADIPANSNNIQVDISSGEIKGIYFNPNVLGAGKKNIVAGIKELQQYADGIYMTSSQNASEISKIKDGTTVVGKSNADKNGNEINATYMTVNAGVTKQQMYNYALPRTFNDIYYLNADNEFTLTLPDNITYTATSSAVGDTTLTYGIYEFADTDFELSTKNSYDSELYVMADTTCTVYFRCTTEYYNHTTGLWETLCVELSTEKILVANTVNKINFTSFLDNISTIVKVKGSDKIKQTYEVVTNVITPIEFTVYSNETYHSQFTINTTSNTINVASGYLGEKQLIQATGTFDSQTNKYMYVLPNDTQLNDNVGVYCELTVSATGFSTTATHFLSLNNTAIRILSHQNFNLNNDIYLYQNQAVYIEQSGNNIVFKFTGTIKQVGADFVIYIDETDLTSRAKVSDIANYTLSSANWVNNEYTLNVLNMGIYNNVNVSACQNWSQTSTPTPATDVLANQTALAEANIYLIAKNGGNLILTCETTPTTDLHITVELFD